MKRTFLLVLAALMFIPFCTRAQWNVQPGYRSFYDLGVNIGTGSMSKTNFEVSTSQGYQIVPTYFYIGTGAAFQAFFNADGACGFPVFVNFRSNFSPGSASPFFDLRVGYASLTNSNVYSNGGFYLSPSIGIRIKLSNTVGLNLRAGYTWEYAKVNQSYFKPREDVWGSIWKTKNIGGATIMAGIDF